MASSEADRPTRPEAEPSGPEIEITPEMIEAGVEAYYSVDRRVADVEFVVTTILRAMMVARHT
jgi:hypothetical protein